MNNDKTIQNLYCDELSQDMNDNITDPTANSEWPVHISWVVDSKCESFDIRVHELTLDSSLHEIVYTVDVYSQGDEAQVFHVGSTTNADDIDRLILIARQRLDK